MIKFSRAFFIVGLALVALSLGSTILVLSAGDSLFSVDSSQLTDDMQKALKDAKKSADTLKANIVPTMVELALGLACGVLGIIYTTIKKRGLKFTVFSIILAILSIYPFLHGAWLLGIVFCISTFFAFYRIFRGVKTPDPYKIEY